MDHAAQVALLERIFRLLDERTTELAEAPLANPVSAYTSPARLAAERSLLLHREPLLVGLSGDAPAPGDSFVHDDSGTPVLVVRTASGALQAFLGLCRHRGARVARRSGTSNGCFRCPYHGWVYDDGGRLVGMPQPAGFADLAAADLALRPLPVAEKHGMIFARVGDAEPIDVDAHLCGAQRELAPLGLGAYAHFARHVTRRAMNWKLVVDTFLEAYHVASLHGRSLAPAILASPAPWDAFGSGGRLVAVRRSVEGLRGRPRTEWSLLEHSVLLYLLFPNTVLIHQIDHVEIVQAHPLGPDESTIRFDLYTPRPAESESARRHFQANFDLLVRVSEDEDFRVGEEIQSGFHAPGSDRVVYGRNEPGVAHYHRMLRERLGAGGARDS